MTSQTDILAVMVSPLVALSAVGILITCMAVILRMTPETDHLIRIFYTTIAAGAFGELFSVLSGNLPSMDESLIIVGIGMLFLFDRRSGYKARPAKTCRCDNKVAP